MKRNGLADLGWALLAAGLALILCLGVRWEFQEPPGRPHRSLRPAPSIERATSILGRVVGERFGDATVHACGELAEIEPDGTFFVYVWGGPCAARVVTCVAPECAAGPAVTFDPGAAREQHLILEFPQREDLRPVEPAVIEAALEELDDQLEACGDCALADPQEAAACEAERADLLMLRREYEAALE